jgi:hypothetical protein
MNASGKTSLLLAALCCFVGCTKTIEINRYPSFYTPDLKSLAVLPFSNDTLNDRAGQYISDQLTKALRANGTYKVLDPRELSAKLGAEELKKLPPADVQSAAELIGRLDNTQAFIIGTTTTFTSARYSYARPYGGYGYGYPYGYGMRGGGFGRRGYGRRGYLYDQYWNYPIEYGSQNQGRAAAQAKLVVIAEGKIVSETAVHVGHSVISEGDPPYRTPDECLIEASKRAVDKLVGRFAIVPIRVKVPLDKALKISADRSGIRAVVSLPPQCDRNPFRLEVTEAGQSDPLLHKEFIWSNRHSRREIVFTEQELLPSPVGRTFVITLYSNTKRIKSLKTTIK